VVFTPAERRLLALVVLLLSAGYVLGGLARMGLLPAGHRGEGRGTQAAALSGSSAEARVDSVRDAPGGLQAASTSDPDALAPAPGQIRAAGDSPPAEETPPASPPGRLTTAADRPSPFQNGRLDLNAADSLDLLELPGVGPALAGRILALRRQRAGFKSVGELRDVRGVGEKRFAKLAQLVCVQGDCRKQ
jgi:DNA uptake protein ComE-like DNA-binding protein